MVGIRLTPFLQAVYDRFYAEVFFSSFPKLAFDSICLQRLNR
jgi:hypothetical protein